MQSLKIGTRLAIGFSVVVLLMLVLLAIAGQRMAQNQQSFETVVQSGFEKIDTINAMRDAVRFQAVALRDIVMQEDFSFKKTELAVTKEARANYQAAAAKLRSVTTDAESLRALDNLAKMEEKVKATYDAVLDLSLNEQHEEAGTAIREKVRPAQKELMDQLETMLNALEKRFSDEAETTRANYQRTLSIMGLLAAGALLACMVISTLITRSITQPLRAAMNFARRVAEGDLTVTIKADGRDETAELLHSLKLMHGNLTALIRQVKSSAEAVAGSTTDLAESARDAKKRSQHQTDRATLITAAVQDLNQKGAGVTKDANGVLESATHMQSIAESSRTNVLRASEANQQITATVAASSEAISNLSAEIVRVTEIASVIGGIAGQTNLLALNAAIEAARAGEQGKGFAVVADEVRTLAARTAASTRDIAKLVETVNARTTSAVQAMSEVADHVARGSALSEQVRGSLENILSAAHSVTSLANDIAAATKDQATVTETTTKHMEEISHLAEEGTRSTLHVDDTAQVIASAAATLKELVQKFNLPSQR